MQLGHCPTGITTHNPALVYGLDVDVKATRVERFHAATVAAFLELMAAMGLHDPSDLRPHHIFRRVTDLRVQSFSELYESLEPGQLLRDADVPEGWRDAWRAADPERW